MTSNRDRVLEFVRASGRNGATNSDIVARTGVRPHQQVFQITQTLVKEGVLVAHREDRGWRFWFGAVSGPEVPPRVIVPQPSHPRDGGRSESPRLNGHSFERVARTIMSRHFGRELSARRVSGIHKIFDFVSDDEAIIGDAKYFSMVGGERLPPAKFSIIAEHVLLLDKTSAKIKFLVFGNDERVPKEWLRRHRNLAQAIDFFFIDADERLIDLKSHQQ